MAEIRIERKSRGMLPWIVGLALLALVVAGLVVALGERAKARTEDRPSAVRVNDETPRHLRQMAAVSRATPGNNQALAA